MICRHWELVLYLPPDNAGANPNAPEEEGAQNTHAKSHLACDSRAGARSSPGGEHSRDAPAVGVSRATREPGIADPDPGFAVRGRAPHQLTAGLRRSSTA